MNMGGLGKQMGDFAQKTAKAQKVKSVKMKIKFGDGKNGRVSDLPKQKPSQSQLD